MTASREELAQIRANLRPAERLLVDIAAHLKKQSQPEDFLDLLARIEPVAADAVVEAAREVQPKTMMEKTFAEWRKLGALYSEDQCKVAVRKRVQMQVETLLRGWTKHMDDPGVPADISDCESASFLLMSLGTLGGLMIARKNENAAEEVTAMLETVVARIVHGMSKEFSDETKDAIKEWHD